MFLPVVVDIEFLAGPHFGTVCPSILPSENRDAWLVWVKGRPFHEGAQDHGAYWVAATLQHERSGSY